MRNSQTKKNSKFSSLHLEMNQAYNDYLLIYKKFIFIKES
jgi:hypothetical protein